jgi:hypothetical protein
MSTPSPLSVKPPSSNFQPTTTNESLILLFTQNQAIQECLVKIEGDIKEIKEEQKKSYEKYNDLEKRVSVEERDKKILIGILAIIVPTVLTILIDVFIVN